MSGRAELFKHAVIQAEYGAADREAMCQTSGVTGDCHAPFPGSSIKIFWITRGACGSCILLGRNHDLFIATLLQAGGHRTRPHFRSCAPRTPKGGEMHILARAKDRIIRAHHKRKTTARLGLLCVLGLLVSALTLAAGAATASAGPAHTAGGRATAPGHTIATAGSAATPSWAPESTRSPAATAAASTPRPGPRRLPLTPTSARAPRSSSPRPRSPTDTRSHSSSPPRPRPFTAARFPAKS